MKKLGLIGWFIVVPFLSRAQEADNSPIHQLIAELYEQYAAESEEEPDVENFFEELTALAARPLELNSSSRRELERLPFLSELQVENLLYHRFTYGAFTSLYELQLVEGFDMTDIRRMLPFIRLGEAENEREELRWWEVKQYGRHELYLRNDYSRQSLPYDGDRLHSWVKYRFEFRDRIRFHLTAEKDAGERWWDASRGGVDFVSSSLQLRSQGVVSNLILGDFTAGFGQGLVLRQGFRRGKSAMTTQVAIRDAGFKRYASTNEHLFFRGAAATFHFGKTDLSTFLSCRKIDATFDGSVFRSIYTSGLHRTPSEIEKDDRVTQHSMGVNLSYTQLYYELGLTAVYTRFDTPLQPEIKPYSYYYFRGSHQLTSGLHYRFRVHYFNFFGEAALTRWPGAGTINGVSFAPSSRVNIALVHRYYARSFSPLFASAFSAQSRVGNESGFYAGVEMALLARWKLSAYADSYRFGWLKYGVDAPSVGNDFLLQLQHSASRKLQLTLRYRYRQADGSERSGQSPLIAVQQEKKRSGRMQLDYTAGRVVFRSTMEANRFDGTGLAATGYAAWQDVIFQLQRLPLKMTFRYLFFDIPGGDNRIYTYETDVLHAFSSPSFSGKGSRYYLVAQYEIGKQISVWLKAAQLRYADGRTHIGSGSSAVAGDSRTEFHFLMRFRIRNH